MSWWIVMACVVGSASPEEEPLLLRVASSPPLTRPSGEGAAERGTREFVVDRGVRAFGPENSLPALVGGAALGAAGVRVDVRRTMDGALVLFTDPFLDRLLDGLGRLDETYYEEIIFYTFRDSSPRGKPEFVLTLAEGQAVLAGPEAKPPALDFHGGGARAVLFVNEGPTPVPNVALDPKDPDADGVDVDLAAALGIVQEPGPAILSDPRAFLTAMNRPAVRFVFPEGNGPRWSFDGEIDRYRAVLDGDSQECAVRQAAARFALLAPKTFTAAVARYAKSPVVEVRRSIAWNLGMIAKHRPSLVSAEFQERLLDLARDSDPGVRGEAFVASGRANVAEALDLILDRRRIPPLPADLGGAGPRSGGDGRLAIEYRARQAFALGLLEKGTPEAVAMLQEWVLSPTLHPDEAFSALDGGMAAWSLGRLRSADSVDVLRKALFREDYPDDRAGVAAVRRMRGMALDSLARIGNDEALLALETALNAPFAKDLDPSFPDRAAAALVQFHVAERAPILAKLLVHGDSRVRRRGVLGALGETDPACRVLLELGAPWAVPWWDAQQGLTVPPKGN